jgi:hypothetical protein
VACDHRRRRRKGQDAATRGADFQPLTAIKYPSSDVLNPGINLSI